jgi:predicted TIM-barrel fold metal-dependent hydrolase
MYRKHSFSEQREAGMRVALYLRVSTDGQTVENQRRELQAVTERHGWEVVAEISDAASAAPKAATADQGSIAC